MCSFQALALSVKIGCKKEIKMKKFFVDSYFGMLPGERRNQAVVRTPKAERGQTSNSDLAKLLPCCFTLRSTTMPLYPTQNISLSELDQHLTTRDEAIYLITAMERAPRANRIRSMTDDRTLGTHSKASKPKTTLISLTHAAGPRNVAHLIHAS